jgi:hypothetical protein
VQWSLNNPDTLVPRKMIQIKFPGKVQINKVPRKSPDKQSSQKNDPDKVPRKMIQINKVPRKMIQINKVPRKNPDRHKASRQMKHIQ